MTYDEARTLGQLHLYQYERCAPTYQGQGVYVIEFHNGIKVGMAKNIQSRLKAYRSPWIRPIVNIQCYKTPNPAYLEKRILKKYSKLIIAAGSSEFVSGTTFEHMVKAIEATRLFMVDGKPKLYRTGWIRGAKVA